MNIMDKDTNGMFHNRCSIRMVVTICYKMEG